MMDISSFCARAKLSPPSPDTWISSITKFTISPTKQEKKHPKQNCNIWNPSKNKWGHIMIYIYTYLIIHIYIYIRIGMGDFNNRHVHSSNKTWEFTPAKPDRTKTRMKSWIWWTDYRGRQERDSTDKEWIPEWDSSMKNGGSMRKKLAISEQPAIMVFQTKCSSNELSNIPQSMAKHGPILQTIIPLHLCLSDRQGTVAVLPLAGLFDNLWSVFGLRQLRLALVRGRSPIVTVVTFGQHFILACWIFVLRVTTCRFSRKTLAGGILMATQFVGAYAPSIFEFNTCEASTRKRVNSLSWKANENNKLEFFWRRWCWVRLARSEKEASGLNLKMNGDLINKHGKLKL